MKSKNFILKEICILLIVEIVCNALTCGIYCILHRFTIQVILGSLSGMLLAVLNYAVMAFMLDYAADKAEIGNVAEGKKIAAISYWIRSAILVIIIFLLCMLKWCDIISLILPLIFSRFALFIGEFFRK